VVINIVFQWVFLSRSLFWVVVFILVDVVIMGVKGRVWLGVARKGVFYGVYFRVFRLYLAPIVCIL